MEDEFVVVVKDVSALSCRGISRHIKSRLKNQQPQEHHVYRLLEEKNPLHSPDHRPRKSRSPS
jgi:hypothetical protein